jgi:hypothetical protein
MRLRPTFVFALVAAVLLHVVQLGAAAADDARITAGTKLEELTVGASTYRDVQVRSINARSAIISHTGGMASIRLSDLSPEWQARFNYSPAAAAASEATKLPLKTAPRPTPARGTPPGSGSKFAQLDRTFGTPPIVQPEVDLRPKFFALELNVKNQGRRPSCAIFAMICALEFQNAELTGRVEKFSEEYLMWALRSPDRPGVRTVSINGVEVYRREAEDEDAGFSLAEVASAIRSQGIPLQSSMPNAFSRKVAEIEAPSAAVVAEARKYRRIIVRPVPGRDPSTCAANMVHALNANVPVIIGAAWPHYRTSRSGYIDQQLPMDGGGHAVTVVGYTSATGQLADAVFMFKNSWGPAWGQGGYGYITYRYLSQHVGEALVIEVQPGEGK